MRNTESPRVANPTSGCMFSPQAIAAPTANRDGGRIHLLPQIKGWVEIAKGTRNLTTAETSYSLTLTVSVRPVDNLPSEKVWRIID